MDEIGKKTLRGQLRDIYRDYRNVLMSKKYYECRLKRKEDLNLCYEIVLAVGTSGAVAGWAIWSSSAGGLAWTILGGVVAILSIVKPTLAVGSRIERYTKLVTHYDALFYDFQLLAFEIKRREGLGDTEVQTYRELHNRMKIADLTDDPNPSARLLKKCQSSVNQQIPTNDLWWP